MKSRIKSISLLGLLLPLTAIFLAFWFLFISSSYQESWSFDTSRLNKELRDSIYSLESHKEIVYKKNIEGKINPRYKTRYWVKKNTSLEDLQILKKYPSGVVKATAFEMLIHKEIDKSHDFFVESFQDTTHFVGITSGCIGYDKLVGEYLFEEYILPFTYNTDSIILNRYQINEKQFDKITSLYKDQKSKKNIYRQQLYK